MAEENKIERKRHGASLRCEVKGCMGNPKPKDIKEATSFCGSVCTKCWAVYDYVEQKKEEVKQKQEAKEQKVKDKTIAVSEDEIEKLIKEADQKEQKKPKTEKGEQLSLL